MEHPVLLIILLGLCPVVIRTQDGGTGNATAGGNSSTIPVIQDYQQVALKIINAYRSRHGSPALQWDLQIVANALACVAYYEQQNLLDHSCNRTEDQGETLAIITGPSAISEAVQLAIDGWYKESSTYNYKEPWKSTGVFGHFTQMIWKSSRYLGFAALAANGTTPARTFVVALYDPSGNIFVPGGTNNAERYRLFKINVRPSSAAWKLCPAAISIFLVILATSCSGTMR